MSGQGENHFARAHIHDPSAGQEMNWRIRQLTILLRLKDFKPTHSIPHLLAESLTERGALLPRVQSR